MHSLVTQPGKRILSARLVERKAQAERQEGELETSSKTVSGLEQAMHTAETRLQQANERVKLAEANL